MENGLAPPEPQLLAILAREIATDRLPLKDLLQTYQIPDDFYRRYIADNPYFKKLLEAYTAEWESISSTNKRLGAQAAMALEEKLPVLASRMGDRREELGEAVAVAKVFKELAGIAPPAPSTGQSVERFSININLGGNTVQIEAKKEEPPLLELMASDKPCPT
jgi:hypothetical protein